MCVWDVLPELFTRCQAEVRYGAVGREGKGRHSVLYKKAIFVAASFILDNSQRHI